MKKLFHILDLDKRKRKRVELFSNLPGKLETLGRKTNIQIKDVSYGGIGVVLPSDHEFEIIESMEAQVEIFGQIFRGNIANQILLSSEQKKVGFKLPEEGSSQISFSTQDPTWDRVADPETVSSIYQDLVFKGYQSPMEIRQNFSRAIVYPMQMLESGAMICEIKEVYQGSLERGRVQCMFELFQTHHAFEGNLERVDATQAQIRLPAVLARLLRRETVRIPKKQAKYDVKLKLSSQAFATKIESYEVHDYSEHGISILDPKGELSLPRNLVFDQAKIEIEGMEEIQGKAEVRSYQWKRDLNAYVVGLKFEPDGEPYLTRWHNLVLKARYPSLDFDYQEKDHQKIWELFESSKYLGLKPRESFNFIYDITVDTWSKMADSGSEFSKRILIRNDREIVGHMQFDKIYPRTWCAHALAIDPTVNKLVSKAIYSVVSDVFSSETASYTITITNRKLGWNQKNYYDFVKHYPYPNHNELKYFYLHEGVPSAGWCLSVDDQISISEATKYDLKLIQKFFEINLSQIEIKALSYDSDVELTHFNSALSKFGLSRKRKFLIAKRDGEFLGFSVMETGSTGISIFGIQDTMYLYTRNDLAEADRLKTFDTILDASMRYYQMNDRPTVNIYMQRDDRKYYSKCGIRFFMEGVRWITSEVVSKRYHAYTNILYGHLLLKRDKIHQRKK